MKVRAIVNGKKVVGWYVRTLRDGTHWIIQDDVYIQFDRYVQHEDRKLYLIDSTHLFEIDISTAAEATGKLDKNGDMMFGSRGEMQGGDIVEVNIVHKWLVRWSNFDCAWAFWEDGICIARVGEYNSRDLEIVKR